MTIIAKTAVAVRTACLDALAVLVPVQCSGCGTADRAVCEGCRTALCGSARAVPCPRAALSVWSALEYEGVARSVLLAFKDGGRTDAARTLGAALAASVAAALGSCDGILETVAIPSTRAAMRRRGYRPVELLMRRAGLRSARILRVVRQTEDQAGLGKQERLTNRAGSLAARGELTGRRFLIIDDIMTTGATIAEAARAIRKAGGEAVAAATVAHTRRLY